LLLLETGMSIEIRACKNEINAGRTAFTLIELLVVISITALITSILIPSLAKVKEQARRTVCSSHIRQFVFGCHLYASNHDDLLPGGHSDDQLAQNEVTIMLAKETRNELVALIGDDQILQCPSLSSPFKDPNGWFIPGNGYLIGYNYLGGHRETPWVPVADSTIDPNDYEAWVSPQKASAKGHLVLVTELNTWSTYEYNLYTFAPHGAQGAITESGDSRNSSVGGIRSDELGAIGGNQGALDGSVGWTRIGDMKVRRATYPFTSCYALW
jgi:prepilin-type N-terminal cleavage/methylation domain-containing protein